MHSLHKAKVAEEYGEACYSEEDAHKEVHGRDNCIKQRVDHAAQLHYDKGTEEGIQYEMATWASSRSTVYTA